MHGARFSGGIRFAESAGRAARLPQFGSFRCWRGVTSNRVSVVDRSRAREKRRNALVLFVVLAAIVVVVVVVVNARYRLPLVFQSSARAEYH